MYDLELFSYNTCTYRKLGRRYETLNEAIDACVAVTNDPFWKTVQPAQTPTFCVKVTGRGSLHVIQV